MNIFIGILLGLLIILLGGWVLTMPAKEIRGVWQTRGHSMVINITPLRIEQYELSERGAYRAFRAPASTWLLEKVVNVSLRREGEHLIIDEGGLTPMLADRVDAVPTNLITVSDPETIFDIFWHTMNENYAFFELHDVDWQARYDEFRPKVTASTTEANLFALITDAMAGLDDRHVSLQGLDLAFSPGKDPAWITTERMSTQVLPYNDIIDTYLSDPQRIDNAHVTYGWLADGIGYIRFDRMTSDVGFGKNRIEPIRQAMDVLAGVFKSADSLIIDVRHNPGGSDQFSFTIAERFNAERHLALTKSTRSGDTYTDPQHVYLEGYNANGFTMPVYLLTSNVTFSAAEIFSWVMADLPQVTVVGERSGGGMSDILGRTLPNGWDLGLSNQRYLTPSGESYESVGIPVDIERPVDVAGFAAGKDTLLEEVIGMVTQ